MENKKYLEGIYCDVGGTLICDLYKVVNKDLLNTLEKLSAEKKVSLWTGGDVLEAKELLLELEIFKFPVLSKRDFRGFTAEQVIDDESQEQFERVYRIKAENYQQINYREWVRTARGIK